MSKKSTRTIVVCVYAGNEPIEIVVAAVVVVVVVGRGVVVVGIIRVAWALVAIGRRGGRSRARRSVHGSGGWVGRSSVACAWAGRASGAGSAGFRPGNAVSTVGADTLESSSRTSSIVACVRFLAVGGSRVYKMYTSTEE